MQFKHIKNGYDTKEVDAAVLKLEEDVKVWKARALKAEADYINIKERENKIKQNGDNIALALTAAIEKAQQIETSSKNVYKLKIQQISILYDRWEMLLNEILTKYPKLEDSHNIKQMLGEFKTTIENVVSQNFENTATVTKNKSGNDTMRSLLSKMSRYSADTNSKPVQKIERNNLSEDLRTRKTELNRIEEKASMIKPITDLTLEKNENYETLAEKFLRESNEEDLGYTNFLSKQLDSKPEVLGENGFSLKEAVNPKDDLDEIMKSFDFFNDISNEE